MKIVEGDAFVPVAAANRYADSDGDDDDSPVVRLLNADTESLKMMGKFKSNTFLPIKKGLIDIIFELSYRIFICLENVSDDDDNDELAQLAAVTKTSTTTRVKSNVDSDDDVKVTRRPRHNVAELDDDPKIDRRKKHRRSPNISNQTQRRKSVCLL